MDKKQKMMLFSIFMILVLITILTCYTFAMYYIDYNGDETNKIPKLSFKINNWSQTETKEISLMNTVNNYEKITPGTKGEFDIELDASKSEVDVKYSIEVAESGSKPSNLLFKLQKDGATNEQQYSSLKELAEKELTGIITKEDATQTKILKIVWEWPYETGSTQEEIATEDEEDNQAGTGTTKGEENVFNYFFSLKVVGTQAKVAI